ncbi:aspartate/glutamate/uridylate kinase [Methanocella paludicola SANAE]|uniref:UMP kinase n=1 Tax=Methanocella paludicola (strain DSM 17711 / JCM 13418 / NBRC 101707 / SANAE) TaxID=304371 RepID=D1Z214_METPS|nr:uridylate kinase [Methanocella paludicola]BAI62736.1 aspartate/glutamate/uridylate kinase [Methanocella paludicola SANAE]
MKRKEIRSRLTGETLVRRTLVESTAIEKPYRVTPELNVIKIGGHGAIDYGREVVIPLTEEIGRLSKKNQILVVTGGGTRVRHIMDIGLDLDMPTGVLSELAGKVSEQNAIMISILLSKYGGVRIKRDDLLELPMLFRMDCLPVTHGTPPFGLYEPPPEKGRIPAFRTDTGAFLIAETMGAKRCIFVKDVDGLCTENPKKNKKAKLLKDVAAEEVLSMGMEDMVIERKVVELLRYAVNMKEVYIVNGMRPENIARVLKGENPGTIIRA